MKAMSPARGNGRGCREAVDHAVLTAVQGCFYQGGAPDFNRHSVLAETKHWAIAFILEKH